MKSKTLVILGEAPGADEEKAGVPFVGASGRLLREQLFPDAGLDIGDWHVLNTFLRRPPNNDLNKEWFANKTELKKLGLLPQGDPLNKRYLLPEHAWQLAELDTRLRELQPDLIVCLGGTALWAVSGDGAIGTHRGTFFHSRYGLALATYHPAALLRQWSNVPLAWADLRKVRQHLEGTLPSPLRRRIWVNPTWAELAALHARFRAQPRTVLGVDIETSPACGQITTFGIGSAAEAIVIPFWNKYDHSGNHNFWKSAAEEVRAWRWVKRFAELPNPKVLQNGLYDSQWLLDAPIPIRLTNWEDDTVVLAHALQPELPKSLGTLASLHLNEPSWKQMRTSAKDAKAEE